MAERLDTDGRWVSILGDLGVPATVLRNRQQPCPFCGGTDRFRFDNKQGKGTFFCNACGSGNGFEFVKRWENVDMGGAVKAIKKVLPGASVERVAPAKDKRPEMRRKWERAVRVTTGDPVWTYLRNRGLDGDVTSALRYSADEPYFLDGKQIGTQPAMLALVRSADGRGQTLHCTYLTPDGKKADVPSPKKVLSALGDDSPAVRLFPADDGALAVTEGIETALAVRKLTGRPVWALISAGGMSKWRAPPGVRHVSIYGDNDASATGQMAAYELAHELALAGVEWEVIIPDERGTDFADLVRP